VLALGVTSWLAGWLLGWEELMLVAAGCLVALVISVPFVFGKALLRVDVEVQPTRVVMGERSAGQMTVTNVGSRRLLPLRMELQVGAAAAEFAVPSLAGGSSSEEMFVLPTERRAVIPVGPATSVRGDPLGLLRAAVTWTTPVPLYVHPRTVDLAALGSGFLRDLEGQATVDLSSSDLAFHALREYQPGDDRRNVHWLTTARVGELMVRQFIDTRRSHLAIVLDGDAASYASDDEFELAVSCAASIAVRTLTDDQELTVLAGGRRLVSAAGPVVLDGFAGIEAGAAESGLLPQVDQLHRTASGASLVLLVTGSRSPRAALRAAESRCSDHARVLSLQAGVDSPAGFRPLGRQTVITVPTLADLPALLWAVMAR